MRASDRFPELPTLANFRDVGGLRTEGGGMVAPGRLFRSDSVEDISDAEADVLVNRLGIRYVIDLRTAPEACRQGRGPLGNHPIGYLNIPLIDVDGPPGPPGRVLLDFYLDHLERDVNLPRAIEAVATAVRFPTLVHCAAGKDRTGVTMLLVELLCGVIAEDARADFLRTASNMEAIRARLAGWPYHARNMATLSPEIYRCESHSVDGLMEQIAERYGTAAGWARAKGVDPSVVPQLRDRLLSGSPGTN